MSSAGTSGPKAKASPQPQDQFEDFRKQVPYDLVATAIPGAFASPARPIPQLEARIGKTHRLRGAKKIAEKNYTNLNWAGGALQGSWVTAVGTWVVPAVSEPAEPQGQEGGWNSSSSGGTGWRLWIGRCSASWS